MSHLDRRQLLKMVGGLAVAGMAGTAAGCTNEPTGTAMEQPSGKTIVVGLLSPAVGPYGAVGEDITNGFKLFLEDSNYLAGTHKVVLRGAEEGATAETAVEAVKGLLDHGAVAIGGVASPFALSAVAAETDERKVPLFASAASPSTFTKNQAYTWRAAYVQGEAGRAIAPFARIQGGRVYVMHDDTPASREEANAFVQDFKDRDGTVTAISAGNGSFGPRLQAARSGGADSIFAAFTGNDALELLGAFRDANLDIKLLGPFTLTETVDLSKLGALPERVYTSGFYTPDLDNEENRRFVSSYHKKYGVQPSTFAMAGHDSISVLDKVLRLVEGDLNSLNINRAASLLGRIDSPRGPWSFNVSRTPQQKWYLRRLRLDGQVPANLLDNDLAVLS